MARELFVNNEETAVYSTGGLEFAPHLHNNIELVYVVNGNGTAYCNGKAYSLGAKSLFITFPNQLHSYSNFDVEDDSLIYIVSISPKRLTFNSEFFQTMQPVSNAIVAEDTLVLDYFKLIESEYSLETSKALNTLVSALIQRVIEHFRLEERDITSTTAEVILTYISTNYKEDLTLEKISKDLFITPTYISRFINNRLGMNFNDYVNSFRLDDATKLIKKGEDNMATVCHASGFSSIRTFNRAFKKAYGVTPTKYKMQFKEKRF